MPPARGTIQMFCAYANAICVALTVGVRNKRVPLFEVCACASTNTCLPANLTDRKPIVRRAIDRTRARRQNSAFRVRCDIDFPPERTGWVCGASFSMKRRGEQSEPVLGRAYFERLTARQNDPRRHTKRN